MSIKLIDKVLVINSGSSSLKFTLFSISHEIVLAKGLVERIGSPTGHLAYQRNGEVKTEQTIHAENHGKALALACRLLVSKEYGVLGALSEVDVIGHRVLHGGEAFCDPVIVTEDVKEAIKMCADLGPLHNPVNLEGIVACETVFASVPNVAVFDTAFHQTMPKYAYMYAIPQRFYDDYCIRKYGFHGTSHCYVAHATAEYLNRPLEELNLIICHLGNGSSIAAIKKGKVLDTTMGLTPLPGLVMGTRCGDIDPAIIFFLARKGMTINEIDDALNKESGLKGINGIGSGDMRDTVNAAARGKAAAQNAIDMFAHRAALYIGGYFTLVGGAHAVVFTGGIGENSAPARQAILSRLDALGCHLDEKRNQEIGGGKTGAISTSASTLPALVIPTNEELMIAREAHRLLTDKTQQEGTDPS